MRHKIGSAELNADFISFAAIALLTGLGKLGHIFPALVFSALHEVGHILCYKAFGRKPGRITVGVFGIRLSRERDIGLSYAREAAAAFAGVAVNFLFAAVFFVFSVATDSEFAEYLALINLIIGCFNLLPARPLDGARGAEMLLLTKISAERADGIITHLSVLTAFVLIFFSFYSAVTGRFNPAIATVSLYICINISGCGIARY